MLCCSRVRIAAAAALSASVVVAPSAASDAMASNTQRSAVPFQKSVGLLFVLIPLFWSLSGAAGMAMTGDEGRPPPRKALKGENDDLTGSPELVASLRLAHPYGARPQGDLWLRLGETRCV